MHIGKSYRLLEILHWSRRRTYILVVLALLPVIAWHFGWKAVALPWPVAALLGTAASFIVGFKNVQTYNRMMEGQQVWMTIASLSRYWALAARDFPKDTKQLATLVRRHLAWLACLRYQARQPRQWESASNASNAEYQRSNFRVPERDVALEEELRRYLGEEERAELAARGGRPGWLLARQAETIRGLYDTQDLVVLHHTEMQKTLKELIDHQGRVERIKNFPYPRQYATINTIFVWCFVAVLPFCLVREFDRMDELLAGQPFIGLAWLAVPFSVLIGWLYLALDQVGESTESPFEGSANDVPISHICRAVENDLLEILGQPALPAHETGSERIVL